MNLKGMFGIGWFVRVILILWLFSAVFVVYLLRRVDWIVHHELYNFGLRFSLEWAVGYWDALRMIYAFLAVPIVLSVVYFGFDVWRFFKNRGEIGIKAGLPRPGKLEPMRMRSKIVLTEQDHMLINCPKCKRVFSKPLVMLDFSGARTRLVNVCPYCNSVLGSAGEEDSGKKGNESFEFMNLKEDVAKQK